MFPSAQEQYLCCNYLINNFTLSRLFLTSVNMVRSFLHITRLKEMAAKCPKVFISRSDYPEVGIKLLQEKCELDIFASENEDISTLELQKRIVGKDAIFIIPKNSINKDVIQIAAQNGLKVIATMSVGLDHIDLEAAKEHSIKVGYTPNAVTEATAEHTVAVLLATSRRIVEGNKFIARNEWKSLAPSWMFGKGLYNSTVGFVGFGRIGQSIAKKLIPFGISKILYTGPRRKSEASEFAAEFVDFDSLLKQSDFVIVTCPLTPETEGIFTADKFLLMKPSAIFINTARGGIVDQEALVYALENKIIAAAGLDVMTPEPLPYNHPLVKLDNCVLTPHTACATLQTREEMAILTAKNILAALQGEKMPAEFIL